MNRFLSLIIVLIVIAIGYAGYRLLTKEKVEKPSTDLTVTVVEPVQKILQTQLSLTGITIPREEVLVITELSNLRVREVRADVGDTVKKGQILAVLDGESLKNQQNDLQAEYERARDDYARVEGIKDTGAVSRQSVTQKRLAMQSARAKLQDAQLNLRRGNILSPVNGIIYERSAAIGALVSASEPLYRIARQGEIEVQISVPEADLTSLTRGQQVTIKLTGHSEEISGTLRLITPKVDNATRTANARISLPKGVSTAIGLFAEARIITGEQQGITLPASALQQDSQGSYVWQLDEKQKAVRLPIKVILRNDVDMIIEDIPTGSVIVARAGSFIKEGDHVNIAKGN